ncbi:MAG TPA: response regulator [bacterium]|nr:response regulator [bacterium]
MPRALIVEDEEPIRVLLEQALAGLGFTAASAENGREGLEALESGSYDLLLTDIRMPEMDGLTMIKRIRQKNNLIPILVITAFPSVDSAVDSLSEGADDYLVKPVNLKDLEGKVRKAVERRRIQKRLIQYKRRVLGLILGIPFWIVLGWFLGRMFL